MLLTSLALAQALTAVPPGATAITVMVCDDDEGCQAEFTALSEHCAAQGIPLLDFDVVSSAGPAGGDARAALDARLSAAAARPDRKTLEAAREAMRTTPLTLRAEEVFTIWLRLADTRLAAGAIAEADEAFRAAAASSGARVYNLPTLSAASTERYLAVVNERAENAVLTVAADMDAGVFVDGAPVGAAPVSVEVLPGWHRVSVERPGRRTAWVGEVVIPADRGLHVEARVAEDDAPAALEAAVNASISGVSPPPDVPERLADWARTQGLRQVRFVRVGPVGVEKGPPEEQIDGDKRRWDVHATWLDVASGRFTARGSGPATLRSAADPDRFSLGLQLGYTRLQGSQPTGPDPHDHVDFEIVAVATIIPELAIDARLGLWASAQPYYLYADWLSSEVVPVHLGLRWTPGDSGVYLGAHGLAVVPMALGGEAFLGWQWHPTPRWRVGIEGHGGYTDKGAVFGGSLGAAFAG